MGVADGVGLDVTGAAVAPGVVPPPVQAATGNILSATKTAQICLRRPKDEVRDVMVSYFPPIENQDACSQTMP